jgi:hypothetical protein
MVGVCEMESSVSSKGSVAGISNAIKKLDLHKR